MSTGEVISERAREKRWQEESDVRTLTEAERIRTDKTRMTGAKKRAGIMAADAMKEANAVKKVAATRIAAKPAKKKGGTSAKKKRRK